jgi:hypothetical protein
MGWVEHRLTKESLGCRSIAFGREQEIDALPCGIHGSVQISVLPFDLDVGCIDAIACTGPFQVNAAARIQFRSLDWDPAPVGNWRADRVRAPPRPCAQMRWETSGTTAHTTR